MLEERKAIKKLLEEKAGKCSVFSGSNFKVYKELDLYGKKVNIIDFGNDKYAIEETRQIYYLELGEYVLSLGTHHDTPNTIDLRYSTLYRTKDGKSFPVELSGHFYSGCVVVIDKKMIAVCSPKIETQFIIVINDELRLIPTLIAEQIIRNFKLNKKHLKSLMGMFAQKGWKIQNEIAINPDTLDVPSFLEVTDWKKRTKTILNYNTDMSSIYSAFIRKENKEKPCIKYISSSNF